MDVYECTYYVNCAEPEHVPTLARLYIVVHATVMLTV